MKLVDIADEIFRELAEPSSISIPSVSFWLEANMGQCNVLLATTFTVTDQEISNGFGEEEKAILKNLYTLHYYDLLIRANLGASAYDWSELEEGDSHIRRVSKNEIAKTLKTLRSELWLELKDKLNKYKLNKVVPLGLEEVNNLLKFDRNNS